MADTFSIREENSDESLLAVVQDRRRFPWGPSADLWQQRRPPQSAFVKTHEIMDLYLFSSVIMLWITAIELTIFSAYILQAEYGIAVFLELDFFTTALILQMSAAFTNIVLACMTTILTKLDSDAPKKAVMGFILTLVLMMILISEIVISYMGKQEIEAEDMNELVMLSRSVPQLLQREAINKGFSCSIWKDKDCKGLYRDHLNRYSNYLIGSASVGIGVTLVNLPVYCLVHRIISRDIAEGNNPAVSSRLNLRSTSSLLSVNDMPEEKVSKDTTQNPGGSKG